MTEDDYIVATAIARLRIAERALAEIVSSAEVFAATDVDIDVRGALGHLGVAISEVEALIEERMADG